MDTEQQRFLKEQWNTARAAAFRDFCDKRKAEREQKQEDAHATVAPAERASLEERVERKANAPQQIGSHRLGNEESTAIKQGAAK